MTHCLIYCCKLSTTVMWTFSCVCPQTLKYFIKLKGITGDFFPVKKKWVWYQFHSLITLEKFTMVHWLSKWITFSFLGMNLVRLSSLAGLLLLSAFWEVPCCAAPVPGKQHLTQHPGPIPSQHLPVGKTMCDMEAKADNPVGTNKKWTLKYWHWP